MASPGPVQTSTSSTPRPLPAGTIDSSTRATVRSRMAAALLTAGLLACFTAGASTARHLAADAADVDAFLATGGASSASIQTISGAALNGATGQTALRQARTVTVTLSSHADWDATTAILTGVGVDGQTVTEALTIPNGGGVTLTTGNLYTAVTSLVIPAQSGTGGAFTIGTGAELGPIDAAAAGVVAFENTRSSATYAANEIAPLVSKGRVWVDSETAAPEDAPVYVRMVAGEGESLGAVRHTPDGNDCALLRGARFVASIAAAGRTLVELNLP